MTIGLVAGLVKEPCILVFCLAAILYGLIMPHVDRAALMDLLEETAIRGYIPRSYELSKTQRKKQKKIIHKSQKKKKD